MKYWNNKPGKLPLRRLPEYRGPLPLWCKMLLWAAALFDIVMLVLLLGGKR